MGKVTALVGGQYGSEGKGNIARFLAFDYPIHVRTGGPNAGHTMVHHGRTWKMRSIPCGWANEKAKLIIGAGAVIDDQVLRNEVYEIEKAGYPVKDRLYIDSRAAVITEEQRSFEGGVNGFGHRFIGSTGEGVGACRMARTSRMMWQGNTILEHVSAADRLAGEFNVVDTTKILDYGMTEGRSILLEGTQGSGLSLFFGRWPYCTSADTNAAQLAADAGVPPHMVDEVILVVRTFPIRVAGNSGPLSEETSWEKIGRPPEYTTVTGKERRVGLFDWDLLDMAVRLNAPTAIALTFCDYDEGYEDIIMRIANKYGILVTLVSHGPGDVRKRFGSA